MCVYARACILVCLGAWRDQNKASDPLDLEFQEALNCHVGTNLVPLKSRNRSSQLSHNSNPISSNAYVHGFQKHFRFLKSSLDASFWNSFFFLNLWSIYFMYVPTYLFVQVPMETKRGYQISEILWVNQKWLLDTEPFVLSKSSTSHLPTRFPVHQAWCGSHIYMACKTITHKIKYKI